MSWSLLWVYDSILTSSPELTEEASMICILCSVERGDCPLSVALTVILWITGDVDTDLTRVIRPEDGSMVKKPVPDLNSYSIYKPRNTVNISFQIPLTYKAERLQNLKS